MLAGAPHRCDLLSGMLGSISLSAALLLLPPRCIGADTWGGSLDVTSDYLVRGISRSDDRPALQLDLHYLDSSGFLADFFTSSTQIGPHAKRDAELSAFLGYLRTIGSDWQGKVIAGNYSYPWNHAGSLYNYDEIDLEMDYRSWFRVILTYSPDTRRYYYDRGVVRVGAEAVEADVQRPVLGKLSAIAGVGYYQLSGAGAVGYAYGSIGAAYDLAPLAFALSYIRAGGEANGEFYDAATGGRWCGTIIWRF